jgi:hypothetical protein
MILYGRFRPGEDAIRFSWSSLGLTVQPDAALAYCLVA